MDWSGLIWIELACIALIWIGLCSCALDWLGLVARALSGRFKEQIVTKGGLEVNCTPSRGEGAVKPFRITSQHVLLNEPYAGILVHRFSFSSLMKLECLVCRDDRWWAGKRPHFSMKRRRCLWCGRRRALPSCEPEKCYVHALQCCSDCTIIMLMDRFPEITAVNANLVMSFLQ